MLKGILFSVALLAMFQLSVDDAQAARKRRNASVPGCSSVVPIGPLIWKGCAGSAHLSGDPRQYGAALIRVKARGGLNPSTSCIPILDSVGRRLTGLQLYSGNNPRTGPYSWRGYTNYGCGSGVTMSRLSTLSRGKPIYLKMNSRQCIVIPRARSNINSSQRC